MRAYERFLNYVKIWTTSDEESDRVPSTRRQFELAHLLVKEMRELGIESAWVDDKCYVYGTIPATPGYEERTALAFLAHLDTSPSFSGRDVHPMLWENYDGGTLTLPGGITLSPDMFPEMTALKGRTLITSDGTTLLGADDKAGIAEIITMAQELISSGEPHGKVCLAFTPDEEIGSGAGCLNIPAMGVQYAYTVDGGAENEIQYETFNAAFARFSITGRSVHPGSAKNKMINAVQVATRINQMLPDAEVPELTEGREGFFHLMSINGTVEKAELTYIVRDHDKALFEGRLASLKLIEKVINETYGEGTVALEIKLTYYNMIEKIRSCMHLVENAADAMREVGLEPVMPPVRGGTDGSQLSFRGLPCPNLGTGGYAFHGPYEHITAEAMDLATKVLLGIIRRYAAVSK